MTEIVWPEGLVRIPETGAVRERLALAGLLGVTAETDYFLELFARQMGGELAETITNTFGGMIVEAVSMNPDVAFDTMRVVREIQSFGTHSKKPLLTNIPSASQGEALRG